MLLQDKQTGALVEVTDVAELIDPVSNDIRGKAQAGQEEQNLERFAKANLVFPSGEELPRCWVDSNYRN